MKRMDAMRLRPKTELQILIFLWRWKISTTAAIFIRFKPTYDWTPSTAYQRMMKLKGKGFVEAKFVNSRSFNVWTLTKLGFDVIRGSIPLLKEAGFGSEAPQHDLYVLAAQYGDWLPRGTVDDVAFFTEQELRRQAPDTLFDWLPPANVHRPDGYWYFPKSKPSSLLALEVEINRKSFDEYKGIGNFYNKYKAIESVLWLVQSKNLAKKIVASANGRLAEFRDIQNFVLLSDFLEIGWSAKIFQGPAVRSTMREFLNKHRHDQVDSKPNPSLFHGLVSMILDTRHKRFDSSTYGAQANFPNW